MRKTLHGIVGAGLLCAGLAQAGTFKFDFNQDPAISSLLTIAGNGSWTSFGGVGSATNAEDGFLVVTSAGGQGTRIIFSDFDEGSVVQGFTFECDLRIGNGSSNPADGFSVNYCRASDPVLTGGEFATGQNCEANLPEEGTQTGIAIGFDAWDSGGTAGSLCGVANQNIGVDVAAVTVRVDGTLVLQQQCPTRNGDCTDATSIQTGPYDGTGSADNLCWAHLKVQMTTDAKLSVWWKGAQLLNNYQTSYFPSAGRLVFAGRTGGSWQNQQVDNIAISTIAATLAQVGGASGYADGFTVALSDSGPSVVDAATLKAQLDGVPVSGLTISKAGGTSTVTYHGFPTLLAAGSSHTISLEVKDTHGNLVTADRPFSVPHYVSLPAGDVVAGVDTAKVGFRLKPWQSGSQPNNTLYTLEQLLGLHGDNVADLTLATDGGYIDYTGVINFNITPASAGGGEQGNFQAGGGYPDSLFPGIGATAGNDNSTIDVLAYLKFAAPGVYEMGVNSDDGFLVTEGKNPTDWFPLKVGEFSGGRGASDTRFLLTVPVAGAYPFRMVWENAGGGANCEWFTIKDGVHYLINDPDATNTTGITAYYGLTSMPASVAYVTPADGVTRAWPTNMAAWLRDGSSTVVPGSIKLYLNGAVTTPVVAKSAGLTTVNLTTAYTNVATAALFKDGWNDAAIVWSDSAGQNRSNAWSFSVLPHAPLPGSLWSATGTASNQGIRVKVFQADNSKIFNGWKNTYQMANQALEGFYSTNAADISLQTNNGYCWLTGDINYVDFAQTSGGAAATAGNFSYNQTVPGLPGIGMTMDNDAAEFKAYVEFPAPGVYYMGVSSDDGFRVTCAESQTRKSMLSVVAPANIAGDLPAMFTWNGQDGAGFGGPLPTTSIVSQAIVADPLIADTALKNASVVAGKIVLIQRGTVTFVAKALAAQAAGAAAVIICNNAANAAFEPGVMGGADGSINIPCLFVSYQTGLNLIAAATTDASSPLTLSIGDDGSFVCGDANYGKGASDIIFPVTVPKAGVYPFRLVWENGGGDANCEWFLLDLATGYKTLLNDPSGFSLKAYITRTGSTPTLSLSTAGGVSRITYTGTLQSAATVNGTYQPVAGASSPYTVPTGTAVRMFYRSSN